MSSVFTASVPSTEPTHAPHLRYRPDIDGLRAVAVVSVVLFHLGALRGGFVGVDVFFVISGFLITSLLWKEIQSTGTVSLLGFYDRRIRRIFPALIVVLVLCWACGYRYLFPGEFKLFAQSLLAAVLSGANLFFWRQSDYFSPAAGSMPLLHTWSLGVEEQFYLFFPPLLVLLFKLAARRLKAAMTAIALVSFVACVMLTRISPDAAYYLPVTRAWQFLCGSLLALGELRFLRRSGWRNAAALLGLLLLGFTLLRFSRATPYPGSMALLPTLAAAMLIAAGCAGKTWVGAVLSWKPIVFVGLISYSVYLWHWPLIVFSQHGLPVRFGLRSVKYSILLLSLVLGALSWRLVERPLRRARRASHTYSAAAVAVASVAGLAIVTVTTNGFASRFPPRLMKIASYQTDTAAAVQRSYRVGSCLVSSGESFADFKADTCLAVDPARRNVLLFGDSHAAMLYQPLSAAFPNVAFQQATATGCLPLADAGQRLNARNACRELVSFTLKQWLPAHHVDFVVIAANWQTAADVQKMEGTVRTLQQMGQSPVLAGPAPEYDMPLPTLLALSMKNSQPAMLREHQLGAMGAIDTYAATAAARWQIPYLSLYRAMCPAGACTTLLPGDIPAQVDGDHLSLPATQMVAEAWKSSGAAPWSH